MSLLAKFRPTILSVKINSQTSDLNPITILSIIYYFQVKFPKEKMLYTYFPKDRETDWFKGYGFIHYQPSPKVSLDQGLTVNPKFPVKKQRQKTFLTPKQELDEWDRFKLIRNNPVQEIQVLKTHALSQIPQLSLSNFTDLNSYQRVSSTHSGDSSTSSIDCDFTPSIFSNKSVKCFVEFSKSNNTGIQSRQTIQPHQPNLNFEQFQEFSNAFRAFGGFKKKV